MRPTHIFPLGVITPMDSQNSRVYILEHEYNRYYLYIYPYSISMVSYRWQGNRWDIRRTETNTSVIGEFFPDQVMEWLL